MRAVNVCHVTRTRMRLSDACGMPVGGAYKALRRSFDGHVQLGNASQNWFRCPFKSRTEPVVVLFPVRSLLPLLAESDPSPLTTIHPL
jgi:hypothetical protein